MKRWTGKIRVLRYFGMMARRYSKIAEKSVEREEAEAEKNVLV
jgi:hypothetical protein